MAVRMQVSADWRGGFVPWGEDLMLPRRFAVSLDDDECDALVTLEVEILDRQPRCRAVTCSARDDQSFVTAGTLKSLPITRYLQLASSNAVMSVTKDPHGPGLVLQPVGDDEVGVLANQLERIGRRRRLITDGFLRDVADLYLRNQADAPTKAVAEHFHTSRQNAGKWVKAARDRGLLDAQESSK
jgi:hypothetical protein